MEYLSMEDYLAGEQTTETRHEYLGGMVFAMAGASDAHNTISLNLAAELRNALRGRPCRAFIGDMKVHFVIQRRDLFYYPDVFVTCDPRDTQPYFKEYPKVIFEVLSETTEPTDRREKFWNYTQIDSLQEYILVAQDKREVTIFRRSADWEGEIIQGEKSLELVSLKLKLRLADIYQGVAFDRLAIALKRARFKT